MGILTNPDTSFQEAVFLQLDLIREILEIRFLAALIGGFFLVAYAFWPFRLVGFIMAPVSAGVTLFLGGLLLFEAYMRLVDLISDVQVKKPLIIPGREKPVIMFEGTGRLLAGSALLAWSLAYVNPASRVAFHWPLDLAVTVFSGALLIYYVISDLPHDPNYKKFWSREEPEPAPSPST